MLDNAAEESHGLLPDELAFDGIFVHTGEHSHAMSIPCGPNSSRNRDWSCSCSKFKAIT